MSVSLNLLSSIDTKDVDMVVSAIKKSVQLLEPDIKTNIGLTICNNDYIEKLNAKYRNINKPTDVLSFPLLEAKSAGEVIYSSFDIDPETKELMLGDIIISIDKAAEQAKEFEHSLARELCYLAIHSVLHLFGYDHIVEPDKKQMRKKEEEILNILGIKR